MKVRMTWCAIAFSCVLAFTAVSTQAQMQSANSAAANRAEPVSTELQTTLLAQASPLYLLPGLSWLPSPPTASTTRPVFRIAPAAGLSLMASGTSTRGRLPKWTSNAFSLGDSNVFEDKSGSVGIGTDTPTSKLTVAGLIETLSGGVKFPDGSIQTTAVAAPRDLDNPTQPLQILLTLGDSVFTVPPGKRFIIEFVTVEVRVKTGTFPDRVTVDTVAGSMHISHNLAPAVFLRSFPGVDNYGLSQTVRLYADPGTTLAGGAAGAAFNMTLSGHLVDAP